MLAYCEAHTHMDESADRRIQRAREIVTGDFVSLNEYQKSLNTSDAKLAQSLYTKVGFLCQQKRLRA